MHAPAGTANQLGQSFLEGRVNVLVFELDLPVSGFELFAECLQSGTDRIAIGRIDIVLLCKHAGMRD